MNNKKHILGLDQFRDILQICPKVGNKKFEEQPLEKEILAFLASLALCVKYRKITDSSFSHAQILGDVQYEERLICISLWEDFTYLIENKILRRACHKVNNEDIRISESYKEYHAIASGKIPPKTKGSKKKADTDTTTKLKPPTVPKEKKEKTSGKGKQKAKELETIPEAIMIEAEQLKIITKRSRKETHSSHASSGLVQMKDTDDEKAQDDEDEDKNDVNETTQDDEDDDVHDDDENAQDDDDEEHTESEDDGDDFIHPKLTTHDDFKNSNRIDLKFDEKISIDVVYCRCVDDADVVVERSLFHP
ncbi:hypothetical protein Tco_0468629 [Tanacetum coccineum]